MKTLLFILLQISLTLPNSTPKQLYTTSYQYYETTGYRANGNSGPHKTSIIEDNEETTESVDNRPKNQTDPLPIGNDVWVLLTLAIGYGIVKKRKQAHSSPTQVL